MEAVLFVHNINLSVPRRAWRTVKSCSGFRLQEWPLRMSTGLHVSFLRSFWFSGLARQTLLWTYRRLPSLCHPERATTHTPDRILVIQGRFNVTTAYFAYSDICGNAAYVPRCRDVAGFCKQRLALCKLTRPTWWCFSTRHIYMS